MKYNYLGKTGLKVSHLCFGTLTISPLQRNLSPEAAGDVIKYAIDRGINFLDTSEFYQNYQHIRAGIAGNKHDVIMCSKSYAYSEEQAQQSVDYALQELDRDYIDIFMLHEQESELTLRGHLPALERLTELKQQGKVRAVGISTHYVAAARAAVAHPLIDVVHPIVNYKGLGIVDGSKEDMLCATNDLFAAGKGVYSMKALGGGNFQGDIHTALDYVLDLKCVHSIAVGMYSRDEVDANCMYFNNRETDATLQNRLAAVERRLHIGEWCTGCGECVKRCPNQALAVEDKNAIVDSKRCLLCGYCSSACPEFCIKII